MSLSIVDRGGFQGGRQPFTAVDRYRSQRKGLSRLRVLYPCAIRIHGDYANLRFNLTRVRMTIKRARADTHATGVH